MGLDDRLVAGRTARRIDLDDRSQIFESLERLVDRSQRDRGRAMANPPVDALRIWMGAVLEERPVHCEPLVRHAESALAQQIADGANAAYDHRGRTNQ